MKYLYCAPSGGFVDLLRQISHCLVYSRNFNRTLVVDTNNYLSGFLDCFSNYFFTDEIIFSSTHLNNFEGLSIFPQIGSDISNLHPEWCHDRKTYVDKWTGNVLTFDMSKDYDEDVLVHVWLNKGDISDSINCFQLLSMNDNTRIEVLERLSKLGDSYLGVHVRNTDYKTDYYSLFDSIKHQVVGKDLLICSDDSRVIDYAKSYFVNSRIITASDIPDLGGRPLHLDKQIPRRASNIDTIVDLLALGMAVELFYSKISLNYLSGYTAMAAYLNKNKSIIRSFLTR